MLLLFVSGGDRDKLPAAEKEVVAAFCEVSKKYWRAVAFLYGGGAVNYKENKKVLGLHGDTLPAMAMNTNDGRVLTFDSNFTAIEIESWVRSYLGYHVDAATEGVGRRSDSPKPPEPPEAFNGGPSMKGDAHADAFEENADNVTVLTTENFVEIVMDRHKDVMVVLQAHDSPVCQEFYKYVKRSTDQVRRVQTRRA